METVRRELLEILPTERMRAISRNDIASKLELPPSMVSKELKMMRLGGLPILWNRNGVYIDYNRYAIERQAQIIENMKVGYVRGMGNIQVVFKDIIDGKYGKI